MKVEFNISVLSYINMLLGIFLFYAIYKILVDLLPDRKKVILIISIFRILVQIIIIPIQRTNEVYYFTAKLLFLCIGSLYIFYVGFLFHRGTVNSLGHEDNTHTDVEIIGSLGYPLILFAPLSLIYYIFSNILSIPGFINILLDYAILLLLSIISIKTFLAQLSGNKSLINESEFNEGLIQYYGISPREREVLGLIAQGMSNKDISEKLFISLTTTKSHIYHLFQKTDSKNRIELLKKISE